MKKDNKKIIIAVDGGGTKTDVLIADLNGKTLSIGKSGASNLRNSGIKASAFNVAVAIKQAVSKLKEKQFEVVSVFIGLPALEEEYQGRENEIKKEILKNDKSFSVFKNKIFIVSDQEIAFKSGTDEKDGIVVIAGTGCAVKGWLGKKKSKSSGWGWLADEGSACWTGQQAYQAVLKSIDGRERDSILQDLIMKELKVKTPEELNKKIYQGHPAEILSQLSVTTNKAAEKGSGKAEKILKQGGKESALAVSAVANRLKFKKTFPLILTGGMFKSKIFTTAFKKEIKNYGLKTEILMPLNPPVFGALKMAKENSETH